MKNFLLVTCIVLTAIPLADTLMTKYGNYQLAQAREKKPFIQADAGRNNSTLWQDQVNKSLNCLPEPKSPRKFSTTTSNVA